MMCLTRACALAWLLVGTGHALTPLVEQDNLRTEAAGGEFEHARGPLQMEFPRDYGPHPAFRHEWWYVTGHLDGAGGERFGFELTFFRYALAPPRADVSRADESRWRTRQIYMAHFAITDIERRQFRFDARYARDALALAGAQDAPFRVWLGDWSLGEEGAQWKLDAAQEEFELTLELRPLLSPVLNGEGGLSRKSSTSGAASYYYSIPRIAVEGTLIRQGRPISVQGLAWLDREWGSGSLGIGDSGWDWFALQLDDRSTLMFYVLRNSDGTRDLNSAGTWVDAGGSVRALRNDEVHIDVQSHWMSPRGGRYPARWRLRVPALELSLDIKPVLADQELDTSPRYWEGAVDVEGRRGERAVRGRGYVELVGYAENDAGRRSELRPPGQLLRANPHAMMMLPSAKRPASD